MTTNNNEEESLRNSIFAAKAAAEQAKLESAMEQGKFDPQLRKDLNSGAIPSMSMEAAAKKDLNYDIPVQDVPLPSMGLLYPTDHPCHQIRTIEIRAMTAKEEDILMNQGYIRKGIMVNELIRSCLLNKEIDPNSLLAGDQAALMYAVRALGYGNDYSPKHKCGQCEYQNVLTIDLYGLKVRPLSLTPTAPFENEFEYILPVTKKKVKFKFLNALETKQIVDEIEAKKKKGIQATNLITARLMANIISVDGETNRTKISQFAQFMPAKDSLALRKFIDDNEPMIETKVPFSCTNCGHEQDINMPLTAEFFWPNVEL